jgi:hypothetical protein
MDNHACLPSDLGEAVRIAHIAYNQTESILSVCPLQPFQILSSACSRKVVVNDHCLTAPQQAVHIIAAYEAGSTGH